MVIVVVAADYGVKARADWPLWDTNMAMPKSSNDFATEQLGRQELSMFVRNNGNNEFGSGRSRS
jgi:hypothetical protein